MRKQSSSTNAGPSQSGKPRKTIARTAELLGQNEQDKRKGKVKAKAVLGDVSGLGEFCSGLPRYTADDNTCTVLPSALQVERFAEVGVRHSRLGFAKLYRSEPSRYSHFKMLSSPLRTFPCVVKMLRFSSQESVRTAAHESSNLSRDICAAEQRVTTLDGCRSGCGLRLLPRYASSVSRVALG